MKLAWGRGTWSLALVTALALGCSSSSPKKSTGGSGGTEETGGSGGSTGGSPGTGGSKTGGTGGGGTGGSTGGSSGSGGGGSGGQDAGSDAADTAVVMEDAAVDTAPPDLSPDLPPPMYEAPRAPWLGRDIGTIGAQVGGVVLNTQANAGQNYDLISSSSVGIGGTADGLFFMHQPMIGAGVIQGRLVSMAMTGTNSAAGLMVRASLDPGAPMVFIGAVGDGSGGQVIVRRAQGEAAVTVPMTGTLASLKAANATMFRLVRTGNTVRVYAGAPNIIETDAALVGGGTVDLVLPGNVNTPLLYGAAVASGDIANPTSGRFNELAISNLGSRPATDSFVFWAIGTSGESAVWGANNRLVLSGNGQPWGAVTGTSRDFLGFAYQRNNDGASLRIMVESQTISDPSSRVAVAVRDVSGNGLPRSAATVALSLTQGVGLELQRRAASTDNDELIKVATKGAITAPLWLRLDKSVIARPGDPLGTTDTYVTAYYTTAANNGNPVLPWTLIGNSFVFPATNANPPGLGIAVASYSTGMHQVTVNVAPVVAAPPPPDGGIPLPDAGDDAGAPDAGVDASTDASTGGG